RPQAGPRAVPAACGHPRLFPGRSAPEGVARGHWLGYRSVWGAGAPVGRASAVTLRIGPGRRQRATAWHRRWGADRPRGGRAGSVGDAACRPVRLRDRRGDSAEWRGSIWPAAGPGDGRGRESGDEPVEGRRRGNPRVHGGVLYATAGRPGTG